MLTATWPPQQAGHPTLLHTDPPGKNQGGVHNDVTSESVTYWACCWCMKGGQGRRVKRAVCGLKGTLAGAALESGKFRCIGFFLRVQGGRTPHRLATHTAAE